MKYKIGDIVKITSPAYTIHTYAYDFIKNRIALIIESPLEQDDDDEYIHYVRFIDNEPTPKYPWDFTYAEKELTKLTKEAAMLELL